MFDLELGTVLAYLAGAAVFTCAVMVAYLSMQRVPPGFGLWTASSALVAVGCVVLADRLHFPAFVTTIVVPGTILLAAVMRLEGLRRLLGRRRFDFRVLVLPAIAVGLLAVFAYAWDKAPARSTVTTVAMALVFWTGAGLVLAKAKGRHTLFRRSLAALLAMYGALWLGFGVYWLARSTGFPLHSVAVSGLVFFVAVTMFELLWVAACLILSAKWSTDALEAAHGTAESERRQLAEIVAFLPDATFALDKDRRVIAWNRAAEERTGVAAEEVTGKVWEEGRAWAELGKEVTLSDVLLDPTMAIPSRYHSVERQGDSLSAEEDWRHPTLPEKSGHLWRTATLLRDAGGAVAGTIESLRDVTWRVEAERALRDSEERYHSLFEHSLDGILVIAPGGTVLDANPAACSMLGMTKTELCASDPGGLTRETLEERKGAQARPALETAVQTVNFVRKDGSSFPAECLSAVWTDAVGRLRAFVQFRDISERVEAERKLRENEARLLEAQEASHIGNWELDLTAQSIWLAPEALRIYGIEHASPYFPLETTELSSLAEDPAAMMSALQEVMAKGGSYEVDYTIRRPYDGARRTIHSFGTAVCDETGTPVKVVGAIRDITDANRPGGGLDLAQHAVDHAGEQVFWVGREGRLMHVSDSTCAELGYTREELLGLSIHDVNPTLDRDWSAIWEDVKRLGSIHGEGVHRTKDGRDISVEVDVNYVVLDGQEYNFVFARDVSERRRLEETLRKTQLSVDRAGEQIFWMTPEGRLVFVTDSICRELGYTREELLGMSIQDIDPTAPRDWRAAWAKLVQAGTLTRDAAHRTKDGTEVPVETVANHVEYEGKEYALVFARNISERRREAQLLPKSEMETLQFQKLEAVGLLAGGIAHDFNNLLTAIIGYGNLILANEEAQGLKSLRRDAEEIRSAAERAAGLTSQILAFARRQALQPQVVALADSVARMDRRLRPLLGQKIELAIVSPPEPGLVEVDPEQFEQVVMHLVRNASEAMPDGGRVTLEIKNVELSEAYCSTYPDLRPGGYVLLSVSDTGVGMDAETKLRIFEPFFTTKPPGKGAGLGLSMVYGTVRQSGGYVIAYSELGKGTTLRVYLPRVSGVAESAEEPAPAGASRRGSETVVVVEDEPPLRRLVARVLGDLGYQVFVAGNGPEALELVEDMEGSPDLLITDVILPGGLQGNELAKELTEKTPSLAVLYMSGHPRDAIIHAGRLDDGVSFLGKPFTPQGLADKVREVLDSGPTRE